jgi:hypothetical protein
VRDSEKELQVTSCRVCTAGHTVRRELALHVAYIKVVVGKPEGERPRVTPRRANENNIKMERERMSYGVDWINQARVGKSGNVV